MKTTSTLLIGGQSFTFEVEDQDEMASLVNSITLASPRRTCNVCGSDGLDDKQLLAYRTKEGYRYVKVQCSCGARSTLGQYRDGDGFFWKEYEEYTPPEGQDQAPQPQPQASQRPDEMTPEALSAIEETLDVLGWTKPQLTNYLAKHFNVSSIESLSLGQGRAFYRDLQAALKQEAPF